MHLHTWKAFRHEVYQSFKQAKDALFNLVDALASEDRAQSLPELSLSPFFERKWSSTYEALEDGSIDAKALQKVFIAYLPQRRPVPLIAVDSTSIARPKGRTSEDRSAQYVHNLPESAKPVTYGWPFSTVVALPEKPSSGTYVLDQRRVATSTTAIQVAAEQLEHLTPQMPKETIVLLDRGYDSTWLWCRLSQLPMQGSLIRLKSNRCFSRPAPPPTGKRGAPRKRGDKLQPNDLASQFDPDGEGETLDPAGKPIRVRYWKQMRLKDADWLTTCVLRVERPQAADTKRDPRISWFVWIGDDQADLLMVGQCYIHRFRQEHGYRFDKQSLFWAEVRVRPPGQFERWSWVVSITHHLLVLARDLAGVTLHPWESRHREPTLQQVRRAMHQWLPQLGTPARPPHLRGKSPGRAKGAHIRKARRFPIVRQAPKVPPLVPK
ncbi:MAG TPA: transposase [Ktedonobacteraceae bacterium]|nr:transposase [Ktedonobacteraceae bacterium]